jgi:isoamylase
VTDRLPRTRLWSGSPHPLGATPDGSGVNFAVHSAPAERVELCLFDAAGAEQRYRLEEVTGDVHHGYLPGIGPGQQYGYRVHGPWRPQEGLRCNPAKLLVDPCARAVGGRLVWDPAVLGHDRRHSDRADHRDSAPFVPRSVVVDPTFAWGDDRPPRTPQHDTVIYEAHVRGLTIRHPAVAPARRGTYAGLADEAVIGYMQRLGVTAVQLMPVHHFVSELFLVQRGLRNYWGYNPLAFSAPHAGYAAGAVGAVREFQAMVAALHRAGIEVILDVVYNHSCEGDHLGPHLSLKGLDNSAYYRLDPADQRHYDDVTGTGNALDLCHPATLRLVLDSLRYWITEMHVDGFRFDLAATLARRENGVDMRSSFLQAVGQDPLLRQVKLIAEPWDLGPDGYQAGRFPEPWAEWNDRFRDGVRDFWRGADGALAELAFRLTGSSDRYRGTGRGPSTSVNFVTSHDGFTLADLVSYDRKHNEANGEHDRDGSQDNRSWGSGAEGLTDDPTVLAIRRARQRSMLATLLLSVGVPMLTAGDELGRTQQGNNNAYCQDNELSWLDWAGADGELLALAQDLGRLRARHPVFRRRQWLEGRPEHGPEVDDIGWFRTDGTPMATEDWHDGAARSLTVFLNGAEIGQRGPRGEEVVDDSFLLLFHAGEHPGDFVIPAAVGAAAWVVELDTAGGAGDAVGPWAGGTHITVEPWAVLVLRSVAEGEAG